MLASKLIELRKFQTERETLLARIAERDSRIRELENAAQTAEGLDAVRTRANELEAELQRARAELSTIPRLEAELAALRSAQRRLESTVTERDRRIAELESEIGESLAWAPPPADDLKRIRGIGPKFEKALNGLGVRSFSQIAAWTEADVAEFAEKLKVHPTRIERDGWVEMARSLAGE